MRNLKYLLMMLLAVLCLASCETEDDKEPTFDKYFRMEVTRCERVSDVLIVDFSMKNISGKDLQEVQLSGSTYNKSVDNLDNKYDSKISFGAEWKYDIKHTMKKNETITGSFRITDFDKTNSAKKISLGFWCRCTELNFDGKGNVNNIKIADNRILQDGIDTNDFGLEYELVSAERKTIDNKDCAVITFTVKNNTGELLNNVKLASERYDTEFLANTGETFQGRFLVGSSDYRSEMTFNMKKSETKTITFRIENVSSKVKRLSGNIYCGTDSYVLCTNKVGFYDIAID